MVFIKRVIQILLSPFRTIVQKYKYRKKIKELQKIRGLNSIYHNNSIATWLISKNGKVDNVRLG